MKLQGFYRILPPLACLLACIAVDLWYFPPGVVFPDEQRFLASAIKLAASGEFWVGSDRAWEMPGTALFFTPAVWLFGPAHAVIPIRLVQAMLLASQCVLIAAIVRKLVYDNAAAVIAAFAAALYPFFLFYQGLLMSETLFNTLLVAALAALYAWRERGACLDGLLVLTCLCFGAATWAKASLTVLPPLLIALTAWTAGVGWRRVATVLIGATCLYAACLSPWWIRNEVVLGAFVPFTTSSAQNLYLGNNPANQEGGIDWATDVEPRARQMLDMPDELARQRAFNAAAHDYIAAHPADVLRVAAKKFVRFWNIVPNAEEFGGIYAVISVLTYGPLLLFALIGAFRQRRNWRPYAPLLVIIAYFTLLHTATIASIRYRLPVEPLLIILAAEPLAALLARRRPRGARS